jgi:two-component system, sensor histidine kinase and response regulator
MQTSEHLIAYQTVSLAAYQRLRETLIQQEHVFDSVITEAAMSPFPDVHHVQAHLQDGVTDPAQKVNSLGIEGFVLMRSASLNVLLTAMPIANSTNLANSAVDSSHRLAANAAASSVSVNVSAHQRAHSQPPYYRADRLVEDDGGDLPGNDPSPRCAAEYRVGLTFDDRAIAVFTDRLKSILKSSPVRSIRGDIHPMHQHDTHPPFDREFDRKAKVSENDKIIAQKAFVLSWAKNLAASPEGDKQPNQDTLDNQVQQSLLLDQVITRIRHSLDLPAILETTVAQVREFLSADRLVLYQFDHFKVPDEKVPDEALLQSLPTDDALASKLTSALKNLSVEGFSPSAHFNSSGSDSSGSDSSGSDSSSHDVLDSLAHSGVGVRSHAGHVTYESRANEEISSVLHLSETECFEPSLPMRARYLMGRPIAVDNTEVQYAHVDCLLDFLRQAQVKSKIIAPIIVQDQLWGLLIAHQCQDYRHWEETEAIFLQHIAEHLAVAIAQASLYQQLRQQTVSLESCVIERTQSLHDALMAAESANITKGEFLSTMSHELRTPLTYIIGMSATLLRWSFGELNDRQRSYLTTINQSGEQLLDVINNILEFASVESGRSILDFSDLSLSELMNTLIAHHQGMAEKQNVGLALELAITEKEDLFKADAKRLQQILSNLIHNAIKFTGAGGQVEVRVWREPRTAIFQVADTGIGIPESQQDILFEKFKQLESPFQRQYAGTGLGLAMTKRLVELHGGSIQIDSQVGKGSTFTVRLPLQSESMPPHYPIAQLEESTQRIILLETDEENAAIACEMLTAAGYEVIWLIESDKLAMQLNLLRPVMLIADLSLIDPAIRNVKAIQLAITALNAKVLALTNASDSASASMAHHDILQKPIDPKVLLSKVRKLMLAPV